MPVLPGTRQSILNAATVEFAQYGFEGGRVDRIASRAKVNKAMIYYHYRSKKLLYRAVIENHVSRLANQIDELLNREMPIGEFFQALSFLYINLFSDGEFLPIFLRELASKGNHIESILHETITQRKLTEKVKNYIETGIAEGKIRQIKIEHAFISFVGMNLFYIAFSSIVNKIWEIDDVQDFLANRPQQVVDLFLNGLLRKQAAD